MVYKWLNTIQFWLYPPLCALCGDPGHDGLDLCPGCLTDLPWLGPSCRCCARPLPSTHNGRTCGACQYQPPAFHRTHALFHYQAPADYLIKRFKFNGDFAIGRLLGELMARAPSTEPLPDLLVPVPLHPKRLRERGFNQALELARIVGRQHSIPVDYRCCERTKHTASQSILPLKQRHKNLRDAFSACTSLEGRRIALIDDVLTSGSTANVLANVLIQAGATHVEVWCLARGHG